VSLLCLLIIGRSHSSWFIHDNWEKHLELGLTISHMRSGGRVPTPKYLKTNNHLGLRYPDVLLGVAFSVSSFRDRSSTPNFYFHNSSLLLGTIGPEGPQVASRERHRSRVPAPFLSDAKEKAKESIVKERTNFIGCGCWGRTNLEGPIGNPLNGPSRSSGPDPHQNCRF